MTRKILFALLAILVVHAPARAQTKRIVPLVDSIAYLSSESVAVYFGYVNTDTLALTIQYGSYNFMLPSPNYRGQPFLFQPGRHRSVWADTIPVNASIEWRVDGNIASIQATLPAATNPDTTGALLNVRKNGSPALIVTGDRFIAYAPGGATIFSNAARTMGAHLAPNSGSWSFGSDRNRKRDLANVDGDVVLQRLRDLPISSWSYTAQGTSVRHVGPTAQDFHAAFGLGESDTTISVVDAAGIALAAVKALEERTRALEARIAQLENGVVESRTTISSDTLLAVREAGEARMVVTDSAVAIVAPAGAVFFTNALKSIGVELAAGSGSWSIMSDARRKTSFAPIDDEGLLTRVRGLPLWSWSYDSQIGIRHVGPTSQDFRAAFGLGENADAISEVDAFGVSLAAARALMLRLDRIERAGKPMLEER
jgi:hypothetical protein